MATNKTFRVTPGRNAILWDGLDAKGRRLGNGVYVGRLSIGRENRISRFMLNR